MSDGRTRLFVALELPHPVRAALAEWRVQILEQVAGLRATAAETIHVTLCFLGWQAEEQIAAVGERCADAAADTNRMELAVGRGLWLPRRRPRVLAVEVEDPSGALARLQAALSEVLSNGGWYERESRRFLPHVTLARAGRSVRVRPDVLAAAPQLTFEGSAVTLFRSRLSPSGARYESLRTVELG